MERKILLFIGLVFIALAYDCTSPQRENTPSKTQITKEEMDSTLKLKEAIKRLKDLGRVWEQKFHLGLFAYQDAVRFLYDGGDRQQAAERFTAVALKYPDTYWEMLSQELAGLLRKMVEEDKAWQEPADVSKLPVKEQIEYYIYKLRDLKRYTGNILYNDCILSFSDTAPEDLNAADKLLGIGAPAIPALLNLLDDKRPTRSVDRGRHLTHSLYTALRYQDVALEILERFSDRRFYKSTGAARWFSGETPKIQEKIIADIKSWWQEHGATWQNPKEQKR